MVSVSSMNLGGLPFRLDDNPPAAGEWRLYLKDVDGWDTAVDDATDSTEHWSGQGQMPGAASRTARQLSVDAVVLGSESSGPGSTSAALDTLTRLGRASLTVGESDLAIVRVADVRVVRVQRTRLSAWCTLVTLSLTADDPLRYSAESRSLANGTVLLPNRGDVPAFGRLSLMGPHSALTIAHPGGTWTFPALGSGASRLIDFRELRVWNGTARVFGEGSGPAPRVLPGGSQWTVSGLGAGTAVLSRAEAWS